MATELFSRRAKVILTAEMLRHVLGLADNVAIVGVSSHNDPEWVAVHLVSEDFPPIEAGAESQVLPVTGNYPEPAP